MRTIASTPLAGTSALLLVALAGGCTSVLGIGGSFHETSGSGGAGAGGQPGAGSATGGSAGSMPGACEGGSSCSLPSECPGTGTKCATATCTDGCCGTTDELAETACSDNGGAFCDGAGSCVACVTTGDCTASTTMCATVACTGNKCVPTPALKGATCDDGGGTVCDGSGHCVSAQCTDGLVDGKETDVDCGGDACSPCADGKKCLVGTDCTDGVCSGSPLTCQAPTCTDGARNGGETDVDCGGGTCFACADTKKCAANSDCASGDCQNLVCVAKPAGTPCTANDQCASNACGTNGTGDCCAAACGSIGGACGASGCDATGACIYVAAGTSCGTGPSCAGGMETEVPACDGAGKCAPPVMTSCGNFTCSGSKCGSTCTIDAQCTAGAFCWQNACQRLTAVSAGEQYTCVVTTVGAAQCFGTGGFGELGDNSSYQSSVPVAVSGLPSGVAAISAARGAGDHTCALTTGGGVQCWGSNDIGDLGNNSTTQSLVPVGVSGLSSGVAAVAAGGYYFTCALTKAGIVQCWGENNYGELGNGSLTNSPVPLSVTGLTNVVAIAAGGTHACALTTGGGVPVQCWGDNGNGQLGNGSTGNSSVPVGVTGLTSVTAIAAGASHTCAVTTGGGVQCWGQNTNGQLGNGSMVGSTVPVVVAGLANVTAIATGDNTTCALTTGGGVQCWGLNGGGQLGNGSTTDSSTPVAVSGLSSGVAAISAGGDHTCALTTAGGVQCWGANTFGELGNSSVGSSLTPISVIEP